MQTNITLKARAKINITLDVLRKREDGYHDLSMIMQSVNLCDIIYMQPITEGIKLNINKPYLANDERNIMVKAARLMKERYDIKGGIFMDLTKNIPIAAGLAGGSTDCASVIYGINKLYDLNLPFKELLAIGKELGADVPFCLYRGTALAEGVGERLKRLPAFPKCFVLLAKPTVGVSTAAVFGALKLDENTVHPDNNIVIDLLKKSDLQGICNNMANSLEAVTEAQLRVIGSIRDEMKTQGALGAMMSGSGPTVFGIFDKYETGLNALKTVKRKFKLNEVYLTKVFNIRERTSD